MKPKRLAMLSLLTALALIIFIIELRIPDLIPIAGVKLGLANIITVYAVYSFSGKETLLLVVSRVILGSLFGGNVYALTYSLAGALVCLAGMLLLRKAITPDYLWLCSVIGAVLHNTGQIVVAVIMMRSFAVLSYYPLLIVSGCIAGLFTGICARFVLKRMSPDKFDK